MRLTDFEQDAKQNLAERKGISVDRLDEVLPAIAGIARAGAIAARGAVSQAAKVGVQAAKKVGTAAVQGASTVGQGLAKKIATKNSQAMAKALLRKGARIPMPTNQPGNRPEEFEVDNLQGDEVTLKNPKPKPGEPEKATYKTKDLDPIIQNLVKQNETK